MWIHTKVNAEGGENEIHKHLGEDHAFIVLEGQMSVFDEQGGEIEVKQYQGVMIPKGAYYRYLNTGNGNLVVIRVGAGVKGQQQAGKETRLGSDGKPLVSGTPENRNKPPIEMIGKFFAEAAG
jgi:mannose-6-phosphate isomerase-like protein (cupin superfamily)